MSVFSLDSLRVCVCVNCYLNERGSHLLESGSFISHTFSVISLCVLRDGSNVIGLVEIRTQYALLLNMYMYIVHNNHTCKYIHDTLCTHESLVVMLFARSDMCLVIS